MKTDPVNLGLNAPQLEAVTAPLGPVLILAGAGSGKTKALTMRIVYLLRKMHFAPGNILAVTFTNKAAGEMKERLANLLKGGKGRMESSQMPVMGTFHSIGARILRQQFHIFGLSASFVIYDDDDQESLLKEILLEARIDPTKFKPSLFAHIIDRAKNNLEEPEDLEAGDRQFNNMARNIFASYEDRLRKNNAVDFGDLISLPVKLFRDHPEVLETYQNLWQYILVDEYQDTNAAQYQFAKLLASAHKNLFVVGDDAQAIYGFRGADMQNILDFEKDYPEAKVIRLEQNYRSTGHILSIAEKVIALSPRQHRKKLWTDNAEGKKPVLYRAEDEQVEAWFVAKTIVETQDGGSKELQYIDEEDEGILSRIMRHSQARVVPRLKNRDGLNHIAVLYRTHAQSRAVEEMLIEASIPYQIVGGLKFYERREIRDMISYLRLLVNPNDLVSLKRVINVPPRSIGPKSFDMVKQSLIDRDEKIFADVLAAKPAIKNFFEIVDVIRNLDPNEANLLDILRNVLKLTGYETYLRDGSEEGESRFENVQELFNVAGIYKTLPWKDALNKFLEEVALMTQADEVDLNSPKVTLMTLHQAKGLEFDTVFLIGLEEGILPHSRSLLSEKDIAEEIRLAYVGITRARKTLYLLHASSRKTFGSRNFAVPSRILKAIPPELLEIYEYNYE
ncbi:MAG TPA: UvrD-helicase domain-containing protein [Patescibacteria group bacterium]|nr:UvrD-helicase domain-containing protein [Patescibacteria group bacterium]